MPPSSRDTLPRALFDFGFGAQVAGDTETFDIFYGATYSETEAVLSLNAVEAEVCSFGQAVADPLGLNRNGEVTFIIGFKGVGGVIVPPNPRVPVPGPPMAGLAESLVEGRERLAD